MSDPRGKPSIFDDARTEGASVATRTRSHIRGAAK